MPKPLSVLALALSLVLPFFVLSLKAQQAAPSTASPSAVSGVVLNATTGKPIQRVLVRMGDQAMLTDHEGRFEFATPTSSNSSTIEVRKPGYYLGPEPGLSSVTLQPSQMSAPITLRLYPEALITGTITGPDGASLSQVYVNAFRSLYNESGHQWFPAAHSMSNSRGEFRLAVPPGDYRIATNFTPRPRTSPNAVLPIAFPAPGTTGAISTIHVSAGSEQHFDLHPSVSATHQVSLRIDPLPERGYPMLMARTSDGSMLPVGMTRPGPTAGDELHVNLPTGTFTLTATVNMGEVTQYGEVALTIADQDIEGVVLHLSPILPIPVQLVIDSGATSTTTLPTAQQLGLFMQRSDETPQAGLMMASIMGGNQNPSFRLTPGTYRLTTRYPGQWFVKSATYGGTNLLRDDLNVVAGGGNSPIVVTVSNQTGSLQGAVKLQGAPCACWISAIPSAESTAPSYFTRSNNDGGFTFYTLPPGSYQVIAFESRHMADYRDPHTLEPFNTSIKSVTVTEGNKASVDLDAIPTAELNP
ncbi:MAG TPA: carboxypeptidase-like regulatory domain-containing protein [Edaphobacter sp.]